MTNAQIFWLSGALIIFIYINYYLIRCKYDDSFIIDSDKCEVFLFLDVIMIIIFIFYFIIEILPMFNDWLNSF